MNDIEAKRLEDFKRILTYRTASKIVHDFNGSYALYYEAPALWMKWKNHEIPYDRKTYELIIKFNNTALDKRQLEHIFGKLDGKWISYAGLIAADPGVKVYDKGTICMSGERFQFGKRYQLPFDFIKAIFDAPALLAKVLDPKSDYYSPRQRRLIFTQILKAPERKTARRAAKRREEPRRAKPPKTAGDIPADDVPRTVPEWLTQKLMQEALDMGCITFDAAEEVLAFTPFTWALRRPKTRTPRWEYGLQAARDSVKLLTALKSICTGPAPKLDAALGMARAELEERMRELAEIEKRRIRT